MVNKDSALLEEAYLKVGKPMPSVPSDTQNEVSVEPNPEVSTAPVVEPAPEVAMTTQPPVMDVVTPEEPAADEGYQDEAEDMAISNLDSVRESIMKIASFCASGHKLEAWHHQKLAIAMDNLAGVARSLGSHCRG